MKIRSTMILLSLLLSACGSTPSENDTTSPWQITNTPIEATGCVELKKTHGDKADC